MRAARACTARRTRTPHAGRRRGPTLPREVRLRAVLGLAAFGDAAPASVAPPPATAGGKRGRVRNRHTDPQVIFFLVLFLFLFLFSLWHIDPVSVYGQTGGFDV